MSYLELWVEPGTWTTRKVLTEPPPDDAEDGDPRLAPASVWRVRLVKTDVTVTQGGPDGDDLGTATWSPRTHTMADRSAIDDEAMTHAAWRHVQEALQAALPLPPGAGASAPAATIAPPSPPPPPPVPIETPVSAPASSGGMGSALWAMGASAVAVAGAILAWRAAHDNVGLYLAIALGVLALGLTIYTLYGAATRCPKCKAWYRRKLQSTELMGTSTENRDESVAVYDNDGKQSGTTTRSVTYAMNRYNYNYECKQCKHHWTRQGTSSRRIN